MQWKQSIFLVRPFCAGDIREKLPNQTLLQVLLKNISISLPILMYSKHSESIKQNFHNNSFLGFLSLRTHEVLSIVLPFLMYCACYRT